MCQLLGMNCNTPTDIVFSFTGFATRGGRTDEHKDGWGIAFFEGNGVRHFVDHQAAVTSPIAELIKRYPIKSENVIAHIRKATQGQVTLENCHPFVRECWGCYWVFAHNGDLKNFHPVLDGAYHPVGTTDSERAFCYLLQEMRRRFGETLPSMTEITRFMRQITNEIAQYGTFNMMLSNGEALFAHCSTKLHYIVRKYPFATASLSDEEIAVDFSEVTTPQDRVAVIVTEPLTKNENWTQFAAGELMVFVDGDVHAA
ncbi:class II glutamine amidotransferase [Undibacterium sp. RTI2.1]|uniref:class II glutamine amidotransferase n=1 Tax=unclassified Undibacterium TaxID=2630295 RepID=UPI002AB399AE|nr:MULTISPECIES: class II glutamine amidotransferase [unclassified Undibacterium]MDY7539647.1 class II glutamine amidotransferase [Undibacterium sp. 5I1]MEB0032773.1 class II glutamine amidotransferase [Undibacterium sp. RTI2.1]MEB0118742.1 class II glutamine amidotransferase [Undibacterium sp. RTI2.2]MEB0232226.1 class II glutamine amidotransferase [Undibacterium sp. 10I3]MEB0257423.1 class II glutamine amidotransferase [Undibacterium sp. 5I1]